MCKQTGKGGINKKAGVKKRMETTLDVTQFTSFFSGHKYMRIIWLINQEFSVRIRRDKKHLNKAAPCQHWPLDEN